MFKSDVVSAEASVALFTNNFQVEKHAMAKLAESCDITSQPIEPGQMIHRRRVAQFGADLKFLVQTSNLRMNSRIKLTSKMRLMQNLCISSFTAPVTDWNRQCQHRRLFFLKNHTPRDNNFRRKAKLNWERDSGGVSIHISFVNFLKVRHSALFPISPS